MMTRQTSLMLNDLSPARRWLVNLIRNVYYGRLKHLLVRGGEPVLDPPPKIARVHKTTGQNAPDPELAARDFALKAEFVDLLAYLGDVQEAVIESIEIRRGLPCEITVEEVAA